MKKTKTTDHPELPLPILPSRRIAAKITRASYTEIVGSIFKLTADDSIIKIEILDASIGTELVIPTKKVHVAQAALAIVLERRKTAVPVARHGLTISRVERVSCGGVEAANNGAQASLSVTGRPGELTFSSAHLFELINALDALIGERSL